jgi:hypothetical protein
VSGGDCKGHERIRESLIFGGYPHIRSTELFSVGIPLEMCIWHWNLTTVSFLQLMYSAKAGLCIHNTQNMSLQWVFSVQQRLSAPLEKSRMNLSGLQIQCLLILARETLGIGAGLIWISTGTLIRTAMQLGYSRDPKHFPEKSVLHVETRRRLWATIFELAMQAACRPTARSGKGGKEALVKGIEAPEG